MTDFRFAVAVAAGLALAGCSSGNDDALSNTEANQVTDNLDAMATDAANDAANAEAVALGTQEQQLEAENAATDATANPTDEDEQNVSGM